MCDQHGIKQSRQEHVAPDHEKSSGDQNSKTKTEKEALEEWDNDQGDLRHHESNWRPPLI
jgi:hypothetical protein